MAEVAEPPVAAPVRPTSPTPPPPSPNKVIATAQPVTVTPIPQPVEPVVPEKGSAKEEMFKALRKKAKVEEPGQPQKTPVAAPKPSDAEPVEGDSDDNSVPEGAAAVTPEAKKKMSPWKLVDEWKRRATEAETKYAEATKAGPTEEQRKMQSEEVENLRKRLAEYEDEIRYVNYSKHPEFQQKYQEPYDKAWARAMGELKELTIADASGEARPVQPADLLEIVNMPLGKAREVANQMFGDFADDVMAHRKEIRGLFDAQSAALEEARKTGAVREQQRMAQMQDFQKNTLKAVGEIWKSANEAALKDEKYGKYFTPMEGDDEGNAKLEKGFALADKAFSENPYHPNLKPEERAAIIKRHAAVRNRAAAFGRNALRIEKLETQLAEATEKLKQYESSEPPTGGGGAPPTTAAPTSAREAMMTELRKRAK